MGYRIVADSSCDLLSLGSAPFATAPLTIRTEEKEFVDNAALDVAAMCDYLVTYKGKSSTACPSIGEYIEAFGDAEEVYCVTITGKLSGSYNAACTAAKNYTEAHPDRRVLVIDSISTGPESALLLEKLRALLEEKHPIQAIKEKIAEYQKKLHLFFALESMRNLANNGRVSPLVAKMAGMLGIRAIGKASVIGTLEMTNKSRGAKKMIADMIENIKNTGFTNGRMKIHHAENPSTAAELKAAIQAAFPMAEPEIAPARGLCSFYAERGGILIGYEAEFDPGKDTRMLLI